MKYVWIAIRMTIVTAVIAGIIYPLAMTGIAQVIFPGKANGSLIKKNGEVIGSSLIGQNFTAAKYFRPRPSAAGIGIRRHGLVVLEPGPDQQGSWPTVCRPRSRPRSRRIPGSSSAQVPIDMVTTSASGLDPDITIANARAQAARVAAARGMSVSSVLALIDKHTAGRQLGFLGEPRRQRAAAQPGARRGAGRREPLMPGADPPHSTAGEASQTEPFALKTLRNRGRHKIFLGYAPGVGKTFTMLSEAQRRLPARRRPRHRLRRDPRARGHARAGRGPAGACRASSSSTAAGRSRRWTPPRSSPASRSGCWSTSSRTPTSPGPSHEKRWQSVDDDPRGRHQRHLDRQRAALREPERHRLRDHRRARARDAARLGARQGRRGRARRPHHGRPASTAEPRRGLRPRQDPRRAQQLLPARQPRGAARAGPAQDGRRGRRELAGLHRRARDRDALGHRGPRGRVRQGRRRWPRSSCAAATAWPSASRAISGSCTCTPRARRSVATTTSSPSSSSWPATWAAKSSELSGDSEADVILKFAEETRATFIVMGQSRRSRTQEILRGSSLIARDHAGDRVHRRAGGGRPEQGSDEG